MASDKKLRPIRWVYDLLREKFPTRKKPLTPPVVGVFDAPTACVQVNLEWSSHVIGALESLNQLDSWSGVDAVQFQARQEVEKLLNALAVESDCAESDMPTLLRQNPSNSCLLEYSTDNGATWALAFDYSLCMPPIPPMIRHRQNPDNPCQYQYSLDNGVTWLLAYDYSLCVAPASYEETQNYYYNTFNLLREGDTYLQVLLNAYINIHNQTINNMYPTLVPPETTPGNPEPTVYHEEALCMLVNMFVDAFCDGMIEAIRIQNEENRDFVVTIAGVMLAAVGGYISGGWGFFTFNAGALTGSAALLAQIEAAGFWLSVAEGLASIPSSDLPVNDAFFRDEEARRRVACCMFNNLEGLPSYEAFKTALDSCEFETTASNEEVIRRYAKMVLNNANLEMYLSFLNMYAGISKALEDEDIPPYDCECLEWCYLFDFTQESYSEYFYCPPNYAGVPLGYYLNGIGWSTIDIQNNTYGDRDRVLFVFTKPDFPTIDKTLKIEWTFEWQPGTQGYTRNWEIWKTKGVTGETLIYSPGYSSDPTPGENKKVSFVFATPQSVQHTNIQGRTYRKNPIHGTISYSGKFVAKQLLICGLGRCPFGQPNYFP